MILWDVNLWVYAFRADSPRHVTSRDLLTQTMDRQEPYLFSPMVAASFLRLVTNPRVFRQPSDLDESCEFIDAVQAAPGAHMVDIDGMTWGIFKHLGLVNRSVANAIPDAMLAALAIRHDAMFVTADAGFKAYQGLRLELIA